MDGGGDTALLAYFVYHCFEWISTQTYVGRALRTRGKLCECVTAGV